jgi:hypothetical protein
MFVFNLTLDNEELERAKFLGLHVDEKLQCKWHMEHSGTKNILKCRDI